MVVKKVVAVELKLVPSLDDREVALRVHIMAAWTVDPLDKHLIGWLG